MLKHPTRLIGGYGIYRGYETSTVSGAWKRYGPGNGVSSAAELRERVEEYASKRSADHLPQLDPRIGCLSLADPVFLDAQSYLDPTAYGVDFPRQVVKFKTFALPDPFAAALDFLNRDPEFNLVSGSGVTENSQRKKREGQAQFRAEVLDAYRGRCCITDTKVSAVIQAAHIQPFVSRQSNHAQNGLPLRSDLHTLFDDGLISVDQGNALLVSSQLDGTDYESLRGKPLIAPIDPRATPSAKALELHRKSIYRPD